MERKTKVRLKKPGKKFGATTAAAGALLYGVAHGNGPSRQVDSASAAESAPMGYVQAREVQIDPDLNNNAWGIAGRAFPNEDSTESADSITSHARRDIPESGGMLHPGDEVILDGSAKIGRKILLAKSLEGQLPIVISPIVESATVLQITDRGKLKVVPKTNDR